MIIEAFSVLVFVHDKADDICFLRNLSFGCKNISLMASLLWDAIANINGISDKFRQSSQHLCFAFVHSMA